MASKLASDPGIDPRIEAVLGKEPTKLYLNAAGATIGEGSKQSAADDASVERGVAAHEPGHHAAARPRALARRGAARHHDRRWRMEDSLGSLRPGKIANFTILERDPATVELDELRAIPVYATVFEGRLFRVEH
jgi:predicted amidohydrolase YtcJ